MQFSLCSLCPGQTVSYSFLVHPKLCLWNSIEPQCTEEPVSTHYPGKAPEDPAGVHIQIQMFQMICKVYTARMQWIEAWSNLGSLKAESELLATTIMLYPAGMVTCVSPDLMQSKKFFAKLLCNRQRTSVILITPLTSSPVSGCFAGNSFHQIFRSPKNMGLKTESGAVHFYLIGLHERFPNQDCRAGLLSFSYANNDHMLSYVPTLPLIYAF